MAGYSLSPKTAEDVDGIYEYSILNFGLEPAQDYVRGLLDVLVRLGANPMLGSSVEGLGPELRRLEYRSHVVFYVPTASGVLAVRVLHARMDAREHLVADHV